MKFYLYDQYGNKITNLTQWDSNVILKLHNYNYPAAPVVHFANDDSEESYTVHATLEDSVASVVVPNILLTTPGKAINVFFFQYYSVSDEGRVLCHFSLPVAPKPRPNDYEYVDNTEVIELSSLGTKLEALIAEATATINVKIAELEEAYDTSLGELRNDISEDRAALEADVHNALQFMVDSVDDGSPRGFFSDVTDLADKPAGVYLYTDPESDNNGYIYYWDGSTLSDRLLYYAGIMVNDGDISYEKLSPTLQKEAVSKVIELTLLASEWDEGEYIIDVSNDYVVTAHTKADIDIDSSLFDVLRNNGCLGIYIQTEDRDGDVLVAYAIGSAPAQDITIQLSIKETK